MKGNRILEEHFKREITSITLILTMHQESILFDLIYDIICVL